MNPVKLIEYSQFLRHRYLDVFSKLPWSEFVQVRSASFDSLRDIFLHCVEVLDRYVNHRIRGHAELPRIRFEEYDSMAKVKNYLDQVESEVNRYLKTVTPEELVRKVERRFKDGAVVVMTVEDMLIDVFQEETHHQGEFIALLWQMGIEPPHAGWGQFLNKK